MQKPQKTAAETKAQRNGCLRLELQRSIVELQLLQRIPQIRVLGAVRWIQAAVHHGLYLLVARQRFCTGPVLIRHRITHPGLFYIFQAGGNVTNHACRQLLTGDKLPCAEIADFHHFLHRAGGHHPDPGTFSHTAFFDPAENDDALVRIIQGVEDQRLQRRVRVSGGRRDLFHNGFQHRLDVDAVFRGNQRCILGFQSDHVLDLVNDPLRLCTGKVDLVDHRNDVQIVIQRQIHIGQRLGLNALGRIHHQHRAVTGCQASGHLVVEVHMPGRIDEVEHVLLPVFCFIYVTHGLRFNGNSPLPLQFHIVQHLCLHLPAGKCSRHLNDPVCQRGFAVVNMGDDTEITNFALIVLCHFTFLLNYAAAPAAMHDNAR